MLFHSNFCEPGHVGITGNLIADSLAFDTYN